MHRLIPLIPASTLLIAGILSAQEKEAPPDTAPAQPAPAAPAKVDRTAVFRKLQARVTFDFDGVPLREFLKKVSQEYGLDIQLDERSLQAADIALDVPITAKFTDALFETALGVPLQKQGMTFAIGAQGLRIGASRQRLQAVREKITAERNAFAEKMRKDADFDRGSVPLREFIETIAKKHDIRIEIDEVSLKDADLSPDMPITTPSINTEPLSNALNIVMRSHGLAATVVENRRLRISARAPDAARARQPVPQVDELKTFAAQLRGMLPAIEGLNEQAIGQQISISGFTLEFVASEPPAPAPDDRLVEKNERDEKNAERPKVRARMAQEAFDNWISSGQGKLEDPRVAMLPLIQQRIGAIDRACMLSNAQKQKLQLAARGEAGAFATRVEELRREFDKVIDDPLKAVEVLEKVRPLREQLRSGKLPEDGLFEKILKATLTLEQMEDYESARKRSQDLAN